MKTLRILFILACLAFTSRAFSQNLLRLTLADTSQIPLSITIGDTFSFTVRVNNDDTVAYNGALSFAYNIQHVDTFSSSTPSSTSGLDYPVGFVTIPPGGSLTRSFFANVTLPAFKTGPSVVVIWPIVTNGAYGQPVSFSFDNVESSIGNIDGDRLKLFVAGNMLRLVRDGNVQISRLRIYDILGRKILDRPDPADSTPMPATNNGVYFAEVTYNNNQRKVFRFYY